MKKWFPARGFSRYLPAAGMLLLPFILFYWMIPFVSGSILGSDYINYHIYHQLDLLFSLQSGSFPLYVPACYYGQSATYPYAQLYHPLTYLVMQMPGFWQGYSLEWLTLFRLLTLAACHLLLYRFLKRIGVKDLPAVLLSLVTVYNLKMLALFWNVVALEAYTGMILLCLAIGWYWLTPERRYGWLLVVLAAYWLIAADSPVYVFYGLVGSAIFALTFPFLWRALAGQPLGTAKVFGFWGRTAACFLAGGLLAAAYLLPFFWDYLRHSSGRIDQTYQWSAQWTDTLVGFVNNFFNPLGAGFSMFGGTPLFLAAVITPLAGLAAHRRVPAVIWWLAGIVLACFLYMQGAATPVHRWAWESFPLVSALRGPARIGMILPLLFMMLLAWLMTAGEEGRQDSRHSGRDSSLKLAAAAGLVLTAAYALLPDSLFRNSHYGCPYNLRSIPDWAAPAILLTSAGVFGLFLGRFQAGRWRPVLGGLLLLVTLAQLTIVLRYGPYAVADKEKMPTYADILAQKQASINFQPVFFLNQHAGSRTVVQQLENYFMEPELARIYRKWIPVETTAAAYQRLNSDRSADEVVIQGWRGQKDGPGPAAARDDKADHVRLVYSAYNRLVFSVRTGQAAFFVLAYPFSENWAARLDDRPVRIFRANGAAQGVRMAAGEHRIEFRYHSPAALTGMVVSCLVLALVGLLAGLGTFRGATGRLLAVLTVLAAGGIFLAWQNSLYSGRNLKTRYTWETPSPDRPVNLAFGKMTRMSSHQPGYPHRYNSRHGVDGGRGVDSCFFTGEQTDPWWLVDLGALRRVTSIVLFTGFTGEEMNADPLSVAVSADAGAWQPAAVNRFTEGGRAEVLLDPPRPVRYVRIQARGRTVLSLNEVEVY